MLLDDAPVVVYDIVPHHDTSATSKPAKLFNRPI